MKQRTACLLAFLVTTGLLAVGVIWAADCPPCREVHSGEGDALCPADCTPIPDWINFPDVDYYMRAKLYNTCNICVDKGGPFDVCYPYDQCALCWFDIWYGEYHSDCDDPPDSEGYQRIENAATLDSSQCGE